MKLPDKPHLMARKSAADPDVEPIGGCFIEQSGEWWIAWWRWQPDVLVGLRFESREIAEHAARNGAARYIAGLLR